MPWDSGSGGSVSAAAQHLIPPQFSAAESVHPSVPPASSSDQSPRHRRRTTSTGSSSESLVRQSVEFESQQLQTQQQQRLGGGMSTRTMLLSQQSSFPLSRQPASNGDTFEPADQAAHSGSGRSSSGPIVVTANSASSAAAVAAAAASAATLQQPECPIVVKRTHSLKDDLIKRFRSKFANNGGPEPHTQHHQQPQQQPQQQQQQKLTRSRPGSLRSGSAATSAAPATTGSASTSGTSVVAKVLPDKKLINKASSSENLGPSSGVGNSAAASDLSCLTSLVQRKRDRSQDSADSSKGSPPRRPAHTRKAPAPPPPPPSPGQATPTLHSSTGAQSSQVSPSLGDAVDESSISMAACKLKPPSGRHRLLPSEDNSEPEECRSRDSPVEDQHGSDGCGISAVLGHHRSNSFEFLQDAVQSRTAPKIRQPSAIRKNSDSTQPHLGDATPCTASPYGSSPPKTVSFNPTDEILTYEGPPSRKSYYRPGKTSRNQQSRLGDDALIEIHSSMVDMMETIVSNQRQFLSRVKEGSISVASYRDNTKNLLTMQTRTIQKILDAIQANEKS